MKNFIVITFLIIFSIVYTYGMDDLILIENKTYQVNKVKEYIKLDTNIEIIEEEINFEHYTIAIKRIIDKKNNSVCYSNFYNNLSCLNFDFNYLKLKSFEINYTKDVLGKFILIKDKQLNIDCYLNQLNDISCIKK